ncbi:hypothetical protein EVG20_g11063 [Dentipellis fragilis]|uniref:DUF155 domain-containing protein n=1 Tax=Dentipellis fragilis TaxID=205917 RepID=A0A4Y9XLZ1_9AGAM|nr:hypothetical protein EVG20_g11063 [Dentipellis fragilis]
MERREKDNPLAICNNKSTWDWMVLRREVWINHGKAVGAARPYLPGSFDRPPRNPADKISSGYKAWEFLTYVFGYCPAMLCGILPLHYWKNFCKLVVGVRLLHQHRISSAELQHAHKLLIEFCDEFEDYYYQCLPSRLHFCRQSVHQMRHAAPESRRTGLLALATQWPMEHLIGDLGQEIRQPSNPFANLSQRGLLHAQVNALKSMIPELEQDPSKLPRGSLDLGDGFVLLRAMDTMARPVSPSQLPALQHYLQSIGFQTTQNYIPAVVRWARLRLPNGQVARSAWKESLKPLSRLRIARNVKIRLHNQLHFAEVQFYFRFTIDGGQEKNLAMVSLFGSPDPNLLELSSQAVWSCTYGGEQNMLVIDIKSIQSVVAMVPHTSDPTWVDRYFVVEKMGLEIAYSSIVCLLLRKIARATPQSGSLYAAKGDNGQKRAKRSARHGLQRRQRRLPPPRRPAQAARANRTTKLAGKLKVLPEQPEPAPVPTKRVLLEPRRPSSNGNGESASTAGSDEDEEETSDIEAYDQIARIPAGTARRDALRLTKKKAKLLPRVTAYATAASYRFDDLLKFFNARRAAYQTDARIIDDVIYTPYVYEHANANAHATSTPPVSHSPTRVRWQQQQRPSAPGAQTGDLLGVPELRPPEDGDQDHNGTAQEHDGEARGHEQEVGGGQVRTRKKSRFDTTADEAEIFLFPYGTVVIWGMTEAEEKRFLSSLKRFEVEKLAPHDVEMEDLNFYYANYSRIYNDVITLRKGSSYMTKLSLSHALSQSVKISLFEELISTTIEETHEYPEIISDTGKIGLSHKEIMKKMGEVFLLRSNIASVGSVLDSPEVFWVRFLRLVHPTFCSLT